MKSVLEALNAMYTTLINEAIISIYNHFITNIVSVALRI